MAVPQVVFRPLKLQQYSDHIEMFVNSASFIVLVEAYPPATLVEVRGKGGAEMVAVITLEVLGGGVRVEAYPPATLVEVRGRGGGGWRKTGERACWRR